MNDIKLYIGPMSKNIVDAAIELSVERDYKVGLIPSRRQIEYNGGYVNHWTTEQFSKYASRLFLVRDHSGPLQGYLKDDGYQSLSHDCEHLDLIHIDPWKAYPSYEEGLQWTIDMINFCYTKNSDMEFEIGTEESIRKFSTYELDRLVCDLSKKLSPETFQQIKYLVIQSGTALKGNTNTGSYHKLRLRNMVALCKKHSLLSKEHNGDYLPSSLIKEKFRAGLDSINIAPEFGQVETQTYLTQIKFNKPILFDLFYKICYDSDRWRKWVGPNFDPSNQKEELINICGHYVLSEDSFQQQIKSHFNAIDIEIKDNIKYKLISFTNNLFQLA
jgi:fructose/tagatose bisphosphate aldolase